MTSRRLVGGGELEHTDMDLEKSGIVYKSISAERKSLGLRRRWGGDMVVYKQLQTSPLRGLSNSKLAATWHHGAWLAWPATNSGG